MRPIPHDLLSRKTTRYALLLAVAAYLGYRLFDRPGDRLWRLREIGRGFATPSREGNTALRT